MKRIWLVMDTETLGSLQNKEVCPLQSCLIHISKLLCLVPKGEIKTRSAQEPFIVKTRPQPPLLSPRPLRCSQIGFLPGPTGPFQQAGMSPSALRTNHFLRGLV